MRATNSRTSSSAIALSSDSIGTAWVTLPNASAGAAPTRRLGLSAPDQRREALLERDVALAQRVILGIGQLGRIVAIVEPIVARQLLGQPGELGLGFGLAQHRDVRGGHQPGPATRIRLAAAARAASVTSAPASIRAISSRRSGWASSRTSTRVLPPPTRLPTLK